MQVVRKLISLSETVAGELDKEKNMSALVDVLLGEFYGVEVVEGGRGGPERDEVKARLAELHGDDELAVTELPSLEDQAQVLAGAQDVVQPVETMPEPEPIQVPTVVTVPVELATPAPDTSEATVIAPEAEPVVEPIVTDPVPESSEVFVSAPDAAPAFLTDDQATELAALVDDSTNVVEVATEAEPVEEQAPVVAEQADPLDEMVALDEANNPPEVQTVPAELPINVDGQPGGQCPIHGLFVGPLCIDCL